MKIIKNIIAIVLFIFGTITIILISSEERGASLFGAFCGYIIVLAISIWIFYTANKMKVFNNSKVSINEKLTSLENLRDSGLLTKEEYVNKSSLINSKLQQIRIEESDEYKKAKKLFDSGILTENEFKRISTTIEMKLTKNENTGTKQASDKEVMIFIGLTIIMVLIYLFFTIVLGWR
jgi:uncharacterized protein YqgQ